MQKCLILLATYNGEKFIKEQIESIKNNTLDSTIYIRDDGSTDNTMKIISDMNDESVVVFKAPTQGIHGHLTNFSKLVNIAVNTTFDYFAFSDQDDIWFPNKLETLIFELQKLERIYGKSVPALVHSDLRVVNGEKEIISSSFQHYQHINDLSDNFHLCLHRNDVTGCATLFNKALLRAIHPIPKSSIVHDHWLAICANYFGVKKYVNLPLVDYRQHDKNAIGAKPYNELFNIFNKSFYKLLYKFPGHISQSIEQAKNLESRRRDRGYKVNKKKNFIINDFIKLNELPFYKRVIKGLTFFPGDNIFRKLFIVFTLLILVYIPKRQ